MLRLYTGADDDGKGSAMADERRPVVETGSGPVRGVEEGRVAAFRGIEYAASPVGPLRFAPPRPHPGWTGVRDAARPGPSVPQGPSRLEAVMGRRVPDWNEDGCLNLNVWTPALEPGAPPRPVLVWFHGGGFSSGSGGWDWYDGARLAAMGGIVVVTTNYRIGALGYLRLPDLGADNIGCQDQAAALRWVRDNIAAFGGDPGLVTVGGQSAGAYSAVALAVDPATSGLVRRVIAQSGPWGMEPGDPAHAADIAAFYLRHLGVDSAADLRGLPVERLLDATGQVAAEFARTGDVAPPIRPVLGGAGLPRALGQAVADGLLDGKDVLLGSNEDELTAFFAFDPSIRNLTPDAARAFTGAYDEYAARRPGASPAQILTAVFGDQVFHAGVAEIAERRADQGVRTYVYRFARRPPGDDGTLGATHCAELPFLFGTFDAYPDAPMLGTAGADDHALARAFGGALAAFTATGSPNADDLAGWPPYRPGPEAHAMRFPASP
ncbi:carboxylesterase/lipase family protein [Actinomadura opuntiae]|uniref:carboxylesterase/lipase family protein n=1 Tax=Actinomadura sp. OS1-43 TaxID=604315 RepID=UPI00255B0FDA|nr:carboxylesterase family protein [Actinomadura sp. OS1-43]MDL4813762.1 carboxylesterase family protein [Actinomadura sp. OS1-43]